MLKLDPKNTELLSQKQKVLNDEIEITSKKLEELKIHQKEINESGEVLSADEKKRYRNLQREIIATQNKLSDLRNENSKFTKFGDWAINFGENLNQVSKKIDSLGNKLTTRLTLPITAAFGGAIKEAIEFRFRKIILSPSIGLF